MTLTQLQGPVAPALPSLIARWKSWRANREAQHAKRIAIDRLSRLSPHLLDDIGIPAFEPSPPPRPELWLRGGAA